MANEEHLKILRRGVKEWNSWRQANPGEYIDLTGASLKRSDLSTVNFANANLAKVKFSGVDLEDAILENADLTGATFLNSTLSGTNLRKARSRNATLINVRLEDAVLEDTDLSGAVFSITSIMSCNLSTLRGLEGVVQLGRNQIAVLTLELTAHGLAKNPANRGPVETFLRGAGVSEKLMQAFALMIENPNEFYSCFISYSHRDKLFARRLYDSFQARGIRCWLDEHQLLPGDDIYDMVDRGIRIWDKVLLCCSEDSLTSWWVEDEIDKALEKEQELWKDRGEKVLTIIPLNLDGYLFDGWQDGRAATIRKRLAADFTGWETNNQKFEDQFERVVQALRTERDSGPEPKL